MFPGFDILSSITYKLKELDFVTVFRTACGAFSTPVA